MAGLTNWQMESEKHCLKVFIKLCMDNEAWYSHTRTTFIFCHTIILNLYYHEWSLQYFCLPLTKPFSLVQSSQQLLGTPLKFKPFFLRLTTPKVERKLCTIFTDNYILAHSSMYLEDNIQSLWWWSHSVQLVNTVLTCSVQNLCKTCNCVHKLVWLSLSSLMTIFYCQLFFSFPLEVYFRYILVSNPEQMSKQ